MIEEQGQESKKAISHGPWLRCNFDLSYLELVLASLSLRGRIQKIDCENLEKAVLAIVWA